MCARRTGHHIELDSPHGVKGLCFTFGRLNVLWNALKPPHACLFSCKFYAIRWTLLARFAQRVPHQPALTVRNLSKHSWEQGQADRNKIDAGFVARILE